MYQGEQEIPFESPIDGLNNRYWTRWYGPWAGADLSLEIMKDWQLLGSFQLQQYQYRGRGQWNLRTDFLRQFQDKAKGTGGRFMIGSTVNLARFYVGCLLYYQQYKTSSGKQYTYYTDLGYDNPVISTFNGALWHSSWINLIIGYHF